MAKYKEVWLEVEDLYKDLINKRGLSNVRIKILADDRLKTPFKVSKSNDLYKYETKYDMTIIINQKVFDLLSEEQRVIIAEESLCGISYDMDKDTIKYEAPNFTTYTGVLDKFSYKVINEVYILIKEIYKSEKQTEDEAKALTTSGKKQF